MREESYFEKSPASSSGKCMETARSSFGEMLLLMAIHFHSGQLSAVCDLVCSTLGMRLLLRPASTARMKVAFTQDIFPEQVWALLTSLFGQNLIPLNSNVRWWHLTLSECPSLPVWTQTLQDSFQFTASISCWKAELLVSIVCRSRPGFTASFARAVLHCIHFFLVWSRFMLARSWRYLHRKTNRINRV